MDKDLQAFLADKYENLEQIERDLVDLEQHPADQDPLIRIYRSLYTIQKNCGLMAFPKLEALTQVGENLLSRLRDGQLAWNADITSTLLQLIDAIVQSCIWIDPTGHESHFDDSELIQRLKHLQQMTKQKRLPIIALPSENATLLLRTPPLLPSNSTQTFI